MENLPKINRILDRVRDKHGTLSDAFRAAGLDPGSRVGKNTRRLIEQKVQGIRPVKPWDLWALRGLLSFRKKR